MLEEINRSPVADLKSAPNSFIFMHFSENFGNSSIRHWSMTAIPKVDKLDKHGRYLEVHTFYCMMRQ